MSEEHTEDSTLNELFLACNRPGCDTERCKIDISQGSFRDPTIRPSKARAFRNTKGTAVNDTELESTFASSAADEATFFESTCRDDTTILDDNIKILNVVISTVMLMASNVPNVPQSYYDWTMKYLTCIKNANGSYPDNISKILRMLGHTTDSLEASCRCPHPKGH